MYGKIGSTALAGGIPAAGLAYTGLPVLSVVVGATTLLAAGLALLRLAPRSSK